MAQASACPGCKACSKALRKSIAHFWRQLRSGGRTEATRLRKAVCVRREGRVLGETRVQEGFTGCKRRGVKAIRQSRSTFVATGVGGAGEAMTYVEFEAPHPTESCRPRLAAL